MDARPVLVIGRTGQVAQALAHVGGARVVCLGRPDADLKNPASLGQALDQNMPVSVINAGGFTLVDRAEAEPDEARRLNVDGPRALALACRERGVPLVHLSTDCVFDGDLPRAYRPDDATNPICTYGRTKLDGEHAVAQELGEHLIVRVSWIFSRFGHNFVRTMLSLASTREDVSVVSDQVGCPTYAPALAAALLAIAQRIAEPGFDAWGIYHLAGQGETDRASLARDIFASSARHGGPVARVSDVPTSAYPTPARRPLNARLDMTRTADVFGIDLPPWQEGLDEAMPVLIREIANA
ncbi:dTDP-4-dehydrorhamnose reductase [Hyphomonas sp.]|uniref:dTDP-4-dehydrorhamnose reductase n=1 Tax=Hyphomonas sp. TaxID=87 RepID=UPI003D2CB1A0